MAKKKEETTLNGETTEAAGVKELSDSELDHVIGGAWVEEQGDGTFELCYYRHLKKGLFQLIKKSISSYRVNNMCNNLENRGYTLKKDDLVYVRTENGVDLYGWPQ